MQYVKIKFHDGQKNRVLWALKLKSDGEVNWYKQVTRFGAPVEPTHVIGFTSRDNVSIMPAQMNPHYAELELLADPID